MRISDWSSYVCSSDLASVPAPVVAVAGEGLQFGDTAVEATDRTIERTERIADVEVVAALDHVRRRRDRAESRHRRTAAQHLGGAVECTVQLAPIARVHAGGAARAGGDVPDSNASFANHSPGGFFIFAVWHHRVGKSFATAVKPSTMGLIS